MDEHLDGTGANAAEPDAAPEEAPPPRPVRGLLWVAFPTLAGAAVGVVWSAYYAVVRGVDPMTPVLIGGGVGLAVGAFLWAFFPYKSVRRKRTDVPEKDPS